MKGTKTRKEISTMAPSPSEIVEGKEQSRQAEMVRGGGEGENGNELLIIPTPLLT